LFCFYFVLCSFLLTFAPSIKKHTTLTVVSSTDFRANMTKFYSLADSGERVVVRLRKGSFCLKPVKDEARKAAKPRRNVTEEVCRAMKDWKEYLETGKSDKFRPAEELIDELQHIQAQ
jgi:hypothetical protein